MIHSDVQAVREEGSLFEGFEAIPEGFGGDEECRDVDEVLHPLGDKVIQLQERDQQAGLVHQTKKTKIEAKC